MIEVVTELKTYLYFGLIGTDDLIIPIYLTVARNRSETFRSPLPLSFSLSPSKPRELRRDSYIHLVRDCHHLHYYIIHQLPLSSLFYLVDRYPSPHFCAVTTRKMPGEVIAKGPPPAEETQEAGAAGEAERKPRPERKQRERKEFVDVEDPDAELKTVRQKDSQSVSSKC